MISTNRFCKKAEITNSGKKQKTLSHFVTGFRDESHIIEY